MTKKTPGNQVPVSVTGSAPQVAPDPTASPTATITPFLLNQAATLTAF